VYHLQTCGNNVPALEFCLLTAAFCLLSFSFRQCRLDDANLNGRMPELLQAVGLDLNVAGVAMAVAVTRPKIARHAEVGIEQVPTGTALA